MCGLSGLDPHGRHILTAFQVHPRPQVGGKVARLDGAALAI
jgi:hypothetical protein